MKHLEIKTIETKGIKVVVKIDYDKGEISLVEKQSVGSAGVNEIRFNAKQWVFATRSIDYMQGWLDILEAMSVAIKSAKEDLRKYQKEKENEVGKILDKAMEVLSKEEKKLFKPKKK